MSENNAGLINFGLAVLLTITGALNTLAAKWADTLKVDGKVFSHPYFQGICMFFGEFSCLIAYLIYFFIKKALWRRRNNQIPGQLLAVANDEEPRFPRFNPFIFFIPAMCDVTATSLCYTGLILTTASSYQMLGSASIIFTGLLSVGFLHTKLEGFKWLGILLVTSGLVVVGISDAYFDDQPNDDINGIITGNLLVVIGQILTSIQMVVEQKFLTEYDIPPLMAVGCEGFFGMTVLSLLLIPFYYIHVPHTFSNNPQGRLEDIFFAFREMRQNHLIIFAILVSTLSLSFYNFSGVTVTKRLSATTRMVLGSVRTLVVWLISIPFFGEQFIPLQILGFILLILGMFVYNDMVFGPFFRSKILPRIRNHQLFICIASFCGIDPEPADQQDLLQNESD